MNHSGSAHFLSVSILSLSLSFLSGIQTIHGQDMIQDTLNIRCDTIDLSLIDSTYSSIKWSLPLVFNSHHLEVRPRWGRLLPDTLQTVPQSWIPDSVSFAEPYIDSLRTATICHLAVERLYQTQYDAQALPKPEKIEIIIDNPSSKNIKAVPNKEIVIGPLASSVPTKQEYSYSNWKFTGRLSAQASQTYISPNWSSGGTTNSSCLLSVYMTAKYNDREFVQFDNIFDLQLGFNTNASDTLRSFSVGTDQLQISSKLGIKAFSRWYYTLQAELITQVADNYQPNTYTLKSSFMSPAKLFVSLGLDYKYSDAKKNLSVLLTPVTYKLNYVRENDRIDPTNYGIEAGKHFGHEFGIKLSSTFNWTITNNISWNSYIYYYSNFGYVDSEWKNTFNFAINRFFTAQVFLHTKYDDRIKRNEKQKTLFQFKDIISLGFTYHFPSFRFQ